MSEKTPEKPTDPAASESSKPSGAESPRTAKELDFDDDVHEALPIPVPDRQPTPKGTKRVSFQDDEEQAPQKPPRPLSPQAHAEATLIEAFPSIDTKVVKAVLAASGGKVEPAFNALLGMSDPNYEQDMAPPPVPRKAQPMSQLEADELYARQLAEQYNTSYTGFGGRGVGNPPVPARRQGQESGLKPNEMYGQKEHSFIDDDLPEIKKSIEQGFETTKTTLSKWFTDIQRKLDGDESNDPIPRPGGSSQQQQQQRRQDFGPSQSNQLYGIQRTAERRSADRERYDRDPQLLGDDFAHRLELRDDEAPPAKPPRPLANPELFTSGGSTPTALKTTPGRQPSPASGTGKAGGKWQPLTSVGPKSDLQDHDPFSLGDSDEEPESAKKEVKDTKPTEAAAVTATTSATATAAKEPEVASSDKKEEDKTKVETKG